MGFSPLQGLKKFFQDVKNAPEAQYITSKAAPTQFPSQILVAPEKTHVLETTRSLGFDDDVDTGKKCTCSVTCRVHCKNAREAAGLEGKKPFSLLDAVVKAAGSRWKFGITMALLVMWGILGAVYGPTDTWQVLLQDVSSIQSYMSATLLMRQQANSCRGLLARICGLISRSQSNERMLRSLTPGQRARLRISTHEMRADIMSSLKTKEDRFDRVANVVATGVGSLITLGVYWAGIVVWVFWGIPLMFSDTWQLYVNTATALEITFVTMFLQTIRQQHDDHLDKCVRSIDLIDTEIEVQLRRMTGDMTPNPVIASQPNRLTRWERYIDVYAFIVGGSIGITISAIVFAIWISVGQPLEFADNWWLIIGTYTGLVAFIDGFILKNVDHRETRTSTKHFEMLLAQDERVFGLIDIECPVSRENPRRSLNLRLSAWIGRAVQSTGVSYGAVGTVGALLVAASAMGWTETAQLLCNTPTMIVEGFLLITLLQAHNMDDDKRRMVYSDILTRRLVLDKHLAAWDDAPEPYLEVVSKVELDEMMGTEF